MTKRQTNSPRRPYKESTEQIGTTYFTRSKKRKEDERRNTEEKELEWENIYLKESTFEGDREERCEDRSMKLGELFVDEGIDGDEEAYDEEEDETFKEWCNREGEATVAKLTECINKIIEIQNDQWQEGIKALGREGLKAVIKKCDEE